MKMKNDAKLTKLFAHVLQNRCFEGISKFPRNLSSQVVFFNFQYIYFQDMMVASEKLIYEFCETIS